MIIILILISSLTCETIIQADDFSWTSPNSLENRRGWVAAGLILINIKRNRESWAGLRENFVFMIDSLLSHTPNTNIHFIVITDEWTRNGILFNFNKTINLHARSPLSDAASLLSSSVSQFLTMNIIAKEDYHTRKRRKNLKLGRIRASYVDVTSLVSGEEELLSVFKANTDTDILNSPGNIKYFSTLFYIAPLYHKKFSALSRLVLLDTDLMFQSSIRDLWRQFLAFSPGQCIGLAPDLSPHYWHRLETLRGQRPDTDLGRPGPSSQGFNSGVALYDLSCLRDSQEYNEQLKPEQVRFVKQTNKDT